LIENALDTVPEFFQIWGIVVVAWLAERRFVLSRSFDPIALFRFVCDQMALKVLPSAQQTQQHYISGALALLVLLAPTITIIYILYAIASFPQVFSFLFLYLALQFSTTRKSMLTVHDALKHQKRQLAKDSLKPWVLRDTQALSDIGIIKAAIESFTLRLCHQQITVMFWFIIFGPVFALTYRLIYEVAQSWNIKLSKFQRFGWIAAQLSMLLQYAPIRLYALILALLGLMQMQKDKVKRLFSLPELLYLGSGYVLLCASLSLNRHMSGAVMYESSKQRRTKYLGDMEPKLSDIKKSNEINTYASIIILAILLLVSWGIHAP
jgi:adenosylcobinamide-phosphate synthase